jgi:hypothetical protein
VLPHRKQKSSIRGTEPKTSAKSQDAHFVSVYK